MTTKDRRLKLSAILHGILGSDNVYFEPPESKELSYPAFVYTRAKIDTRKADNHNYMVYDRYEVTFIRKKPDSDTVDTILELPMCSHDRQFVSNDLYHDVFTIYIQ